MREHERPKSREETPKEVILRHPMNAKSPTIGHDDRAHQKGVTSLEGYMGRRPFRAQSR
jgi:hypothetical protein